MYRIYNSRVKMLQASYSNVNSTVFPDANFDYVYKRRENYKIYLLIRILIYFILKIKKPCVKVFVKQLCYKIPTKKII